MSIGSSLKSNIRSGQELVSSGLEGANTVWKDENVGPAMARSAKHSWAPMGIGILVGTITGFLADDRRPARGAIIGGVVGGVVGFGTSVAWQTRELIGDVASGAMKNVTTTRDAHWLQKHPVPYG